MKLRMNNFIAYGLIVLGASFWGVTGLFVQNLYRFGFTPWQVVAIRLSVSSLILFTLLALVARSYLKIRMKDLPYFFGLGVLSIALFNWCYFAVMERASLSIAVIFVYTSPVFAAVIANFFFKEKITIQKSIAILCTILGCGFVIGFFPSGGIAVSGTTILLGVLSGFFCSLFSIIGKHVSRLYHPLTITLYSMVCGSVFMIPTSGIWTQTKEVWQNGEVWSYILGISIISTIFAYVLYTLGLMYVESSKAAVLSSFELVVSVMIGVFIFHDPLTAWQWTGFMLIALSVFLTVFSLKRKNKFRRSFMRKKVKAYY